MATVPEGVLKLINGIITTEGDYSDNPADKGGKTRWGITEAVARENGYTGDMRELPKELAFSIYYKKYFQKPGFDKIAERSLRLAYELTDSGVNFGPTVPTYWLQYWLNGLNGRGKFWPDIVMDGHIGPATLQSLDAFLKKRGQFEGERLLCCALNCSQAVRYLELAEGREANEDFLYGWVLNRVVKQLI